MALRRVPSRLLILITAALSLPCFAQIQPSVQDQSGVTPRTRSIEGSVLDKSGAPVAGAIVLLKNTKTLQVRSFIAQQDGKYHFYGLSPDINYQVRAESRDMTSPTKQISVFDSHSKITVNLKLKKKRKPNA
ncbi:MAG: carboxypeptidase regulatory-like domain-containing protein [Acidobacteriaceae bacterium]|nr:carboxypeptidase regulatory-like domain-containing protein [Acidobacteriaceae bacterium]MBV9779135.1 carboxypeptidase regulatory-like domain-containing protein [Acidobacteriaceae bacterium]